MSIVVQKFGGTSVADSTKILAAARKAIRAQQQGNQVVMVVSAMGKNTDMLVSLAGEINERPPAREMDMLLSTGEQVSVALMAMAIDSLGHKAVSLTGAQIGIRTDSTHTKARIRSISTDRMRRLLDEGQIVIAAGFQGIDEESNITTLGRGGSDTTAVALAAVLRASCEIYTDVDGIYTTDPRIVPEARRAHEISYDEMLELASLGAGVMHSRSIEFAKKFGVSIHVRSSLTDTTGTWITNSSPSADQPVSGAAVTKDEARITVLGVPDVPGSSNEIFSRIAEKRITVDMVVQNVSELDTCDISFTVPSAELAVTLEAVAEAAEAVNAEGVTHDENVSKISVVGKGMAEQAGVANQMFRALADAKINIQMITTSEIKISVLVARDESQQALRACHQAFQLHVEPEDSAAQSLNGDADVDADEIVARLRGDDMEELLIEDITLDETQARVTVSGVPDTPGVAARVFDEVADAGIFVDMIVQSYPGTGDKASLTFTVAREHLAESESVAKRLAKEFACRGVSSSPAVAKLSVSGIGLRSHTSVGTRMFRSLSATGINIEMINTSEVQVNVVVDGSQGQQALDVLKDAFADVLR